MERGSWFEVCGVCGRPVWWEWCGGKRLVWNWVRSLDLELGWFVWFELSLIEFGCHCLELGVS